MPDGFIIELRAKNQPRSAASRAAELDRSRGALRRGVSTTLHRTRA